MAELNSGSGGWIMPVAWLYDPVTVSSTSTSWTYTARNSTHVLSRERTEEDNRKYLEAQRRRREARRAAEKKAEALFLSCLTDKQREQFGKDKSFKVTGSAKGRYIISCSSTVENVYRTRYGKPVMMYCAGPRYASISYDIWLAQKLILESDEMAFLKVAVASGF